MAESNSNVIFEHPTASELIKNMEDRGWVYMDSDEKADIIGFGRDLLQRQEAAYFKREQLWKELVTELYSIWHEGKPVDPHFVTEMLRAAANGEQFAHMIDVVRNSDNSDIATTFALKSGVVQQSDRDQNQIMTALNEAEDENLLTFSAKEVRGLLFTIMNQQVRLTRLEKKVGSTVPTSNEVTIDERAEFEAHAKKYGYIDLYWRLDGTGYNDPRTSLLFAVWKARGALSQETTQ